MSVFDYGLKI